MKLATLKSDASRDGRLIVVSRDNKRAVLAEHIAPSLREAVENWGRCRLGLEKIYRELNAGSVAGEFPVDQKELHSPLPRSFQWADGSAFLHHVKLVRKARGAEMPPSFLTTPLMYQGGSDTFLAPTDEIPQVDPAHGTDFEGEIAVVTDDVPMGVSAEAALNHIILVMLVNDVSLRGLIPEELAMGFGFLQSKPSSAFSPFALSPGELEKNWQGGRLHLPLLVKYNGQQFGKANGKEMHFHFGQLIAHAARTRDLSAGTIIGSGTVSNEDPNVGSSCLAERRMIEQIETGTAKTPFMKIGDTVEIQMLDQDGQDLFGTISQKVSRRSV
jgi:fumarylacetoacetate (FAA) hydrolase